MVDGRPALRYSYRAYTCGGPGAGGRGPANQGRDGPRPAGREPGSPLIVQLALSLAPQQRVLGLLRPALAGGVIVILLAGVAGGVPAGTALSLIARLTGRRGRSAMPAMWAGASPIRAATARWGGWPRRSTPCSPAWTR